jgi:hypothetical protein
MQQVPVPVRRARVGHSALLALVLTIGLALFAAYAGPYGRQEAGPRSSPARTGVGGARAVPVVPTRPPPPPSPSALPALRVFGEPIQERLLVDAAGLRLLDLGTGTLGPVLADTRWPSQLIRTASGFICVCVTTASLADGEMVSLRAQVLDRSGRADRPKMIGSFRGYDDPALKPDEQGNSIAIGGAVSDDESTLFLGLAQRNRDSWRRSVLVVDLRTGAVGQRVELDRLLLPKGEASSDPTFAFSPEIVLSPSGRRAVVSAEGSGAYGTQGVKRWRVSIAGTRLESLSPLRGGSGTLPASCSIGGYIDEETYYSLCGWGGDLRLIRARLDGSVLKEQSIEGMETPGGFVAQVVDMSTKRLYLWNTSSRAVARLDLARGALDRLVTLPEGKTGSRRVDLLGTLVARLSNWVAPAAMAKMLIEPALALSPDGTRLYALGMSIPESDPGRGRSTGVYVVDTESLSLLDRWAPTTDLMSLAVSPDGRYVYAAGMAGVDSSGQETSWPASLTAYDRETGVVRLIAGDLGTDWVILRDTAR